MTNDVPGSSSQDPHRKTTTDGKAEPKISTASVLCRICYDNERDEELITPCDCKGTVAFVHRSCLETWLGESNTTTCELCHQVFKTERTPKYTSWLSILHWCKNSSATESTSRVRSDVLACAVITPLAIVITYVCLFSSEYYSQKKFVNVPAARWTSVSLLVMIAIMLIGYYMWVYSVMRMHARIWYNWWQRTCEVRYIPTGAATVVPRNRQNRKFPDINDAERGRISSYRFPDRSRLNNSTQLDSDVESILQRPVPDNNNGRNEENHKENVILFEYVDVDQVSEI